MSKNQSSTPRFFNVRHAFLIIALLILCSLSAAASNAAGFSFFEPFKQLIGIESFAPPLEKRAAQTSSPVAEGVFYSNAETDRHVRTESLAGNPSVVVNKFFNSGTSASLDAVELLVIQSNLDLRGMIIKDFSSNMGSDGGGKFTFSTNALWSGVRSGTVIILRNDASAADTTAGGSDYKLDVGLANTTYFTSSGGSFDLSGTDMVMIKEAASGTAGTSATIHVLAGGAPGALFTAAANPKLIAATGAGNGQYVYAASSSQSINDFNGTDAAGGATGLTFGAGNNANNTAYLNSLRISDFTLAYDGNGNTSGATPASVTAAQGSMITLPGQGALAKTGYSFAGWNTQANGGGAFYGAGAGFTIPAANATLYAQWTINQYSVNYDGNGNTGGTAPAGATGNYNSTVTTANAGTLVKNDHAFAGWNTAADGSGAFYAAGSSLVIPAANLTLYAQWAANSYTITASATGGTISPAGVTQVSYGGSQNYSWTPDAGNNLAALKIDGAAVPLPAGNVYTFTNVTANRTIEAIFANCPGVSTPALAAPRGSIVAIPVNTTDLTGLNAIAAQFVFTYDASVLSSVPADISVTPGSVLPTGANAPQIDYNADTPGTIYVSVFGATPFAGAGSLVDLNMKVTGAAGTTSPLGIGDFLYNGGLICANAASGALTVAATPTATSVTSSMNPSVYGSPVTFTATVEPIPPGGTVDFVIDGATIAAGIPLNGAGEASLTTAVLTAAGSPHAVSANYSGFGIEYSPSGGALGGGQTVTKADQTISVAQSAPASVVYGASFNVAATASSGLSVAIASSGACTGGGSGSASVTMTSGTGVCTLFYQQTGDGNHNAAPELTSATVAEKASATWTTAPSTKVYGDADPAPLTTGAGSGFLAADNVTATYVRAGGESAGVYHLTALLAATGDLNNYNITNDGADFTIAKRPATWTTDAASKLFGDADPLSLTTGSGANFLAADEVTATYTRAAGEVVGTYPITANLNATGDLGNYLITNAGADFTIIGRTLTGSVTYKNAAVPVVPVANTTIAATGSIIPPPVTNLLDGTFSMTGFGAGAYTVTAAKAAQSCLEHRGIFADDASLIARHVVRFITLNETQIEAGKVSGLSQLSSFDAALIAQYIVCLGNPVNRTGQWKFTPASLTVGANSVQNFEGILKGDVNGTWTADAALAGSNPLAADEQNAIRAGLPAATSADAGSVVTLPLKFDNLRGNTVGSLQFDVEYDPSVVEPIAGAASMIGTNAENLVAVSNAPRPGLLKVVVYGAQAVGGDGIYANLKFNVTGRSGASTDLAIRALRVNDGQAEVVIGDGRLTVAAATNAVIRGRVLTPTGQIIARARVVLTAATGERRTMLSNSFGVFEFAGLVTGETYTLSVADKEFRFTPRAVSVTGSVIDLDMIADQ